MNRTQFTFYESFFRAASRIRNGEDRAMAYDVLCSYALYGVEPELEHLPDAVAIAFEIARPNLDASRRRANSGASGGKSRGKKTSLEQEEDLQLEYDQPQEEYDQPQEEPGLKQTEANGKQTEANGKQTEANGKQTEANGKQTEANGKQTRKSRKQEKEQGQEKEKEKEKEKEQLLSPVTPFAAVMSAYMDKINPQPTELCVGELKGFWTQMGGEVCLRAINIAADERKVSWSYIRAILRNRQEQGVRCLADWDRLEEERRAGHGAAEHQAAATGPGEAGTKWNIRSALDDC